MVSLARAVVAAVALHPMPKGQELMALNYGVTGFCRHCGEMIRMAIDQMLPVWVHGIARRECIDSTTTWAEPLHRAERISAPTQEETTMDSEQNGRPETAGETLERLGTDGDKWAEAYRRRGNPGPVPREDLGVFFANAIEAGRSAGYADAHRDPSRELLKALHPEGEPPTLGYEAHAIEVSDWAALPPLDFQRRIGELTLHEVRSLRLRAERTMDRGTDLTQAGGLLSKRITDELK